MRHNRLDRLLYLQRKLDRLFRELLASDLFLREEEGYIEPPPVDLFENAESVVVEVELPGLEARDITLYVTGDVLVVEGSKGRGEEKDCQGRERSFGRFHRSVELPAIVNPSQVEATLKNGLLIVTVPRIKDRRGACRPIGVRQE